MTKQEILKLPKYSKARMGGVYRIADLIYIDNLNGLGADRSHREITTRGIMNNVPIDTFLKFKPKPVEPGSQDEQTRMAKIESIKQHIANGGGVACPRVFLNIDQFMNHGRGKCTVIDTEGTDVCRALQELGITDLNVHFVLLGYSLVNIEDMSAFYNYISAGIVATDGTLFAHLVKPAHSNWATNRKVESDENNSCNQPGQLQEA